MSRYRSRMGNDRKARREIGRRLRKGGVMMCMMITSAMLLSACSGGNSSSKNTTAAQTTEAAAEGGVQDSQNEVMGRVKLVSDTEITVEQGPGGAPGQNSDGQQPGGAPGQDGDNQQPSGAPDGQNQPPQGGVPEGKGQPPQGKTTTYKITTSTTFTDADGALIQVSDIKDGDFVKITTDGNGTAVQISLADMPGGPDGPQGGPENGAPGTDGPGGGAQSAPTSYSSVKEFTSDTEETGQSYISEGTDESAVLVSDGANVTLKDFTVNRTSEDSKGGDSSSFYGVGASVLATDGTVNLSGGTITSDADGAAGAFAYDKGTVNISDTTITTTGNTAGGIHVAGGGTVNAENLTVHTSGESSAAIRSDRGGGTMRVKGGSYTSSGIGSPAVYCTADIEVNDAKLTAENSEAVCIEGLNSLSLTGCDLSGHIQENEQNDCDWTVILYQSMSGDSEVGNSTFQMDGGTITSKNGGLFYTTNTECTITLKDVDITYNDDNEFFLQCTGNNNQRGWGQSGANGSDCNFTADSQDMKGNVIWDSISDLDFYMINGSTLEGAFVNDESNAGNGGDGYCNVVIDKDSTWTVTGDSTITSLSNAGTITDADGKTVSIVGTDGTTYVEGDSDYTITVGSYQDSADTSASTTVDDWSNYEVERPESL